MEIENSSLFNEIEKITLNGVRPVNFYWKADIHMLGSDLNEEVLKVVTINIDRNYEVGFADEIMVETRIPLGVYAKLIYPSRNTLEMTLYRLPIDEVGAAIQDDKEIDSERFKAVLVLDGLPKVEGADIGRLSREALDNQDILIINFQLLSKSLEKIRVVNVGGIFRNSTPENVIRSVLAVESNKEKVDGGAAIDGVDIVEGNNSAKRDHIVIPQGTMLLRVPTFIQERCGGFYSTGIGSYLQNRIWYVYPLYDTTKLDKAERSLTLIKVHSNRYNGIERTYREEGGSIFVLGTSGSNFTDDGGTQFMNEGNGVRLADANQFMSGVAKTTNNKTVISRGKLNSEFITQKSDDGLNNVQTSVDSISANPYVEYSRLSSRFGGLMTFVWENANPRLLFPGMKVRVLYLSEENIVELHGVLLGVQSLTQLAGTGLAVNRHITTCNLNIFVNKPTQ